MMVWRYFCFWTIIYFHDSFGVGSITPCSEGIINYTLGIYSKEKIIINNSINLLKTNYESDYDDLKLSLGITNDFLFEIRDLLGNKIPELSVDYAEKIPTGINIEVREIPIRVININGQIQELVLYIKAW